MHQKPLRKLNLLIVDDDPAIVRLLERYVRDGLGDRIELATLTEPNTARQWINENCCDVLLTDLCMPGTDGLALLRFAKQRNAWTQAIFMTAHSTWEAIEGAIENGASDYLLKPVDRDELLLLLEQALARFGRWQQAVQQTWKKSRSMQTSSL